MKVLSLLLFLYLTNVNSAETVLNKDITTVDIVLTRLKDQHWSEDEGPCLDQTALVLNNVRNYILWAVWIWNSMHNPTGIFYGSQYSLGNYDQCLQAPSMSVEPKIVTQYCLTDVILTNQKYEKDDRSVFESTEAYVSTKNKIGRNLNKVIWGACLPAVCKPHSISKILKTIYLANPITSSEPEIIVDYCQVAGTETEFSFGFYAFIILVISLTSASVFSTYYFKTTNSKSGVLHSIADSFSLKRNWNSLIKESSEEIGVLNLLKLFSATLAVSTHTAFFEVMGPISNGLTFDEFILQTENPIKNAVKHIDLAVDNFLMVSGLLLVKGLMDKRKKPLVALVHRYFRLIASFTIIMFYMASVSMYTGNGPIWQRFAGREQKACSDNWLLNLLMLNNYVNSENICLIVSWYIPCDYQLAVMGTILYLLWQKNKTIGKTATIIITILALLMPGIVTYWRGLPGMILFRDLDKILDFRKNDVYLDTYIRSHNRAGPFLLGMTMGYIMSTYKPEKYRNIISKERSFLLFAVANIILYRMITSTLSWTSLEYDHLSSALYAVYSRNLWAFATCLVIGIVEYGYAAAVRKVTNWHGFTILSRLTYGIYVTHSLVLQQNIFSRRNPQQFDVWTETVYSMGVLFVSGFFALLLWLFVEAPFNNIVNLFTNSGSKDKLKTETTEDESLTNLIRNNKNNNKGL